MKLFHAIYTEEDCTSLQQHGQSCDSINVNDGVRQGGILSPYLFSVYMDELSTADGHLISNSMLDNCDMSKQNCHLYAQGNMLIRKCHM